MTLAESQDWEPVEFKQGHKVSAGEYGWRIYCGVANLTQLRDQTYPALRDQRRLDRPNKGQMAVKMAVKTPLIETEWITAIRPEPLCYAVERSWAGRDSNPGHSD